MSFAKCSFEVIITKPEEFETVLQGWNKCLKKSPAWIAIAECFLQWYKSTEKH